MRLDDTKILINNIPEHMRKKTINALVKSFVESFATQENAIESLHNEVFIDYANGDALDEIGALFNLDRLQDETDNSYRARLKATFQTLLLGGTTEGIKKSISLMLGFSEDDIEVVERYDYKNVQVIDTMEAADWIGSDNVSADTTNYYETFNSEGVKTSPDGSTDNMAIFTELSSPINVNNNILKSKKFFRVWAYVPDATKINYFRLLVTDGTNQAEANACNPLDYSKNGVISDPTIVTGGNWIYFSVELLKQENPNVNFSTLSTLNIQTFINSTVDLTFDYFTLGSYDETNIIEIISVNIEDEYDPEALEKIQNIVDKVKPVGTYYKEIGFGSANNIFRLNISEINGEDIIL